MVYRGRVKDGQVVFDDAAPPDGALVSVETVSPPSQAKTFAQIMKKYAGAVKDGPADLAENHDHYAHGAAKRTA